MSDIQRLERLLEEIRADVKKLREERRERDEEQEVSDSAISIARAALKMNCSSRHVQRLIHSGQLLATTLGSKRMVRIPMSEVRRFTSPAMPKFGQQPTAPAVRRRYSPAQAESEYLRLRGRGKPTGPKKPKR